MCLASAHTQTSLEQSWMPRSRDRYWVDAQRAAFEARRVLRLRRLLNACWIAASFLALVPFVFGILSVLAIWDRGYNLQSDVVRTGAVFMISIAIAILAFASHNAMKVADRSFQSLNGSLEKRLETMETAWSMIMMTAPPDLPDEPMIGATDRPDEESGEAWPGAGRAERIMRSAETERLAWHARRQASLASSYGTPPTERI